MTLKIATVISETLQAPEVREALQKSQSRLNEEFLVREIGKRQAEIESAASESISALNADLNAEATINARLMSRADEGLVEAGCMWIIVTVCVLIGSVGALSYYFGWGSWDWFVSAATAAQTFSLAGVAIWLVAAFLLGLVLLGVWAPIRQRRSIAASGDRQKLDLARVQLKNSEDRAREAIRKVVVANVFELVNAADAPFYSARLHVAGSPARLGPGERLTFGSGLSEAPGAANEAPTDARADILDQIRQMPGGSIGISGPRGVGKSTLLSSICKENPIIDGAPALAILTAAPVKYGDRDFLLHLHASLCRQVLKTEGEVEDRERDDAWQEGQDWQTKAADRRMHTLGSRVSLIGILMFGAGSIAAMVVAAFNSSRSTPSIASADTAALAQTLEAIGFKPGPLILFGIGAIVVGQVLVGRIDFRERIRGLLGLPIRERTARAGAPLPPRQNGESTIYSREDLVQLSLDELRSIRFQRSYTTGWAGGLKIPAGLELSAEQAMSLAQIPYSLPELVDRYRSYVEMLARHYGRVVVGIDELDKLTTTSDAETFLNAIKAVFNIPGCYYLISVSEHALASFERRGIGFRDAFDSAFDDVHHLSYLDLQGSRALLVRRIINLPDPFLRLCHMLSGGLPRDLIRIGRTMLDIAGERDPGGRFAPSIRAVAGALIARETVSKIRATSILVRAGPAELNNASVIAAIERIQLSQSPAGLRKAAEALSKPPPALSGAAEPPAIPAQQLELSVYLSFLAAIGLVAAWMSTRQGWESLDGHDVAGSLARVRQGLETSAALARERLRATSAMLDRIPNGKAPRKAPPSRRKRHAAA